MKQFAPSCDRNRDPILSALSEVITAPCEVLEIGSGTGQHAVYFSEMFPYAQWQPTDVAEHLPSIEAWREEAALDNVKLAVALDLNDTQWPIQQPDVVVCINTVHIVAWPLVEKLFAGVGKALSPGGALFLYGPFRYANRPLETSNEEFDVWLKTRDPGSGIRDFELIDALAQAQGLKLAEDREMPANNRSLWWIKQS